MKALVLAEYKKLEYMDVETPAIEPDEVLVQVKACGICGSDVHGFDGSTGRRRPPVIMGHEASGVIAEVGGAVTGWKKGDRVTFDSTVYCGHCDYCRRGRINLCANRRVLGVSCDEYRRNGAFAEYVAIPQHILYKLPDAVTFDQATIVEPLSVAFHAVNLSPRTVGASATVVGTGMVGLLVVQTLRAAGCGTIIAIDNHPEHLELAKTLGADITLLSHAAVHEEVKTLTQGEGTDLVLEVAGTKASVHTAIACVRKGGAVTLVGNISPSVDLPLQVVVTRELTLQGSCASNGEYPACLDMIARGAVNVDAIISQSAPLSDGQHWFSTLYNKEGHHLKIVLNP